MSRPLAGGRHDWLGYCDPVGQVVAPAVLARLGLWPEPQGPAENGAVRDALARAEGNRFVLFGDVLGWPADLVAGAPGGPPLPERLRVSLHDGETLLEPSWAVRGQAGDDVQLLVRIEAPDVDLDRRGTLGGWEATAQQRFERLLRETGVLAGVLVGARATGRREGDPVEPVLRLVVAPRGEAASHLSWPLSPLADVSGRGMLAGLKLLLDRHALFTGAPSHRLLALIAESRAARATVSARLAGQVLASLHELLRGLDAAAPDLVRDLAERDPDQLYKGLLTVLLRLIFILYAEDRGLMPSVAGGLAATLYEQGYALGRLHVRLADERAQNPDTVDERRGAWGHLLALFRLVGRGDPSGFMQPRGGKLFDERAFPFLLGGRTANDPEQVLPVSDGCIGRVLDALLVLDGERVAYRALSVEQIGAVYETVMGFTVERARGPMLAIRAGRANKVPVWVDLAALAAADAADRARLLKEWTGRGQFPGAVSRALRVASTVAALEAALAPVVDARACPRGASVGAGTPILQPTDERRRTGSHYTPPSLAQPLVRHALQPALDRIGPAATPAAVLDIKLCDPAVGSGALLVEACRQLGARLVDAWDRHPTTRPTIPPDEDALLHAKRLVAQHCLHGVDRNPLALDLAKLSLWLETLARDHEFTFLDHVLRHGDSLVGLPNPKITAVTWGKVSGQHSFIESVVREALAGAAGLHRLIRAEAEIASYAMQANRHREAETALGRARLIADAVLEAFFAGANARERAEKLADVQQYAGAPSPQSWARLEEMRARLHASPIGITGFHWELEFQGVFDRPDPGFDAIVGNPPFAGKNTIASGHALAYPDWLKTLHPGAHGNADLSAHFFRRAFGLLRRGGAFGLLATNTIRQGDTRETGLARIVGEGGTIIRAVSRIPWEGEAAVVVAQVFVRKGEGTAGPVLDDRPVRRISAYLVEGELDGSPAALRENGDQSFQGSILLGMGFTFDDVNAAKGKASPLAEMERLIDADPRNSLVIKPYLGGEEVNNSVTHSHHRFAIDFEDWPLRRVDDGRSWTSLSEAARQDQLRSGVVSLDYPHPVAADWPELLAIVEQRVRPERDLTNDVGGKRFWWRHLRPKMDMYTVLRRHGRSIVAAQTSPHLALCFADPSGLFGHTLVVFPLPSFAAFATLQSRLHEIWVRTFGATMKDDQRYLPTDCFETFPLPPGYDDAPALETAGRAYHDHRAALMIERGQGMTPTYNRFHDPADRADDIAELRRLHAAVDRAVLDAYGWGDVAAPAVFLDEASEDDHRYRGRLFWPAPVRDDLLARLLRLNAERSAAERRL